MQYLRRNDCGHLNISTVIILYNLIIADVKTTKYLFIVVPIDVLDSIYQN